ncbi:acyclic terpene utilization AtuA family protein [Phenylobacterium sp.]|jgi:hypothetical protein|uniref:acyclic terpene utilization AtuA family protein n=1 Tax=Phenylobacterium sp. TaxID=1871053 RepID=UPI002F411CE1
MKPPVIRIGAGAGYSGDRIEPAVELVEKARLDYLVFECLAERTIAMSQAARRNDPDAGYDPHLYDRMRAVLPAAARNGVRIVTNMGAANPRAAAQLVARIAREAGLPGLRIAAVLGDDVLESVLAADPPLIDRPGRVSDLGDSIVSANAYLGAEPIAQALAGGAAIVITGRVGDPALFLGPLIHAFQWRADDWALLGRATVIGHLLECAGQLTGGYFADPGIKDVSGLARLGFPFAEVSADGSAVLGKVAGSGGKLSVATCKEQLLYEILDPAAYLQPDVTADFTDVHFEEIGPDRVAVSGGGGRRRPAMLKVSIGYGDGFIGEGQISYAGPGAAARGRLALEIVRERLALTGVETQELSLSLIGIDAVDRRGADPAAEAGAREVRARVAGRTRSLRAAKRIGAEVETLYTNGPFGGGGVTRSVREVTAVASALLPRELARPSITFGEA